MTRVLFKSFAAALSALLLIGGLALRANAQNSATLTPFPMDAVQVSLPKGVSAEKRNGPDFFLYYFTTSDAANKKRQILFAYLGYYPSFPKEIPKGIKEQRSKVNGRPARTFSWKDGDGKLCRESLIDSGVSPIPDAKITYKVHFAYAGLTPEEAKLADGIIATLGPTPRPKQTK